MTVFTNYCLLIMHANWQKYWSMKSVLSDWLLLNEQFFSYFMVRTSYIWSLMRWWWGPLCTRPTYLDFYSVSSLKQQSSSRHHFTKDTLSWFWASQSPECCVLGGEAANTNFIVLWFNLSGAQTYDLPHSRRACK